MSLFSKLYKKIVLLFCISTVFLITGYAFAENAESQLPQQEQQAPNTNKQDTAEKKGKPVSPPADPSWPQPFVPTDKINADSVISFPADI
jgi:hypothetical protein